MSDTDTAAHGDSPTNQPKDIEKSAQDGEMTQEKESSRPAAPERAKTGESRLSRSWTKRHEARTDGKKELKEDDAYDKLGFSFPTWKKWAILSTIFMVQMSMNFNTSVYP